MTKLLTVKCPRCETQVLWSEDFPHRPFCSERCRHKDFIAWADEENVIAGSSVYEDMLTDQLEGDDSFN